MRLWVPFMLCFHILCKTSKHGTQFGVFVLTEEQVTDSSETPGVDVAVFLAEVCDVYGSSAVDWFFKP